MILFSPSTAAALSSFNSLLSSPASTPPVYKLTAADGREPRALCEPLGGGEVRALRGVRAGCICRALGLRLAPSRGENKRPNDASFGTGLASTGCDPLEVLPSNESASKGGTKGLVLDVRRGVSGNARSIRVHMASA